VKRKKGGNALAQRQAQMPRWFKSDKNQAVAEWLAHNYFIDKLAGREPSPDVPPYCEFKRSTVVAFLAKLQQITADKPVVIAASSLLLAL
jgi:hypothetical protein